MKIPSIEMLYSVSKTYSFSLLLKREEKSERERGREGEKKGEKETRVSGETVGKSHPPFAIIGQH